MVSPYLVCVCFPPNHLNAVFLHRQVKHFTFMLASVATRSSSLLRIFFGRGAPKCADPGATDQIKKALSTRDMFCFQCQEARNNTGCTGKGNCGKSASTANLQDVLVEKCKEIAVAYEHGNTDIVELGRFLALSLFITITNANFDDKRIIEQIKKAEEILKASGKSVAPAPVGAKSCSNPDINALRELTLYGLKGLCAYADHAAMLDHDDPEIYKFLVKALAALTKDLSADELTKLALDTGHCAVRTMALLDKANTEAYGNPVVTKVNIGVGTRPGILVSGHDLRDLKDLLEQTKDAGVDVYTHGEMLPAHYYPELKKYPHLYGNYGGSWWHQDKDFATFNGPILMTTNCIIPVQKSYAKRIFTTGAVGYAGLPHIPDRPRGGQKDFSAIIEMAKKCKPPKQIETGEIVGGFAHNQVMEVADKVIDAVKKGAIKKFVVMAGCDGRQKSREYFTEVAKKLPKDTVILTAGCAKYRYNKLDLGDIGGIPRVLDAGQCNDSYSLAVIALKLKEAFGLDDVNKLPLSFDIAWYEQKAIAVLLALLALGFKDIRCGPTLPAFLSPGVAEVLVKNFGIMPTTTVEADLHAIATGK